MEKSLLPVAVDLLRWHIPAVGQRTLGAMAVFLVSESFLQETLFSPKEGIPFVIRSKGRDIVWP